MHNNNNSGYTKCRTIYLLLYSSYYYFLAEMVPAHLQVQGSNLLPIKIGIIIIITPTSKQKTMLLLVLVSSMPKKQIQLVTTLLQPSVQKVTRTAIVIMFTMSKPLLLPVVVLVKEWGLICPYLPRHPGQRWKNLQSLLCKAAFEVCLWTESSKFDTNL